MRVITAISNNQRTNKHPNQFDDTLCNVGLIIFPGHLEISLESSLVQDYLSILFSSIHFSNCWLIINSIFKIFISSQFRYVFRIIISDIRLFFVFCGWIFELRRNLETVKLRWKQFLICNGFIMVGRPCFPQSSLPTDRRLTSTLLIRLYKHFS